MSRSIKRKDQKRPYRRLSYTPDGTPVLVDESQPPSPIENNRGAANSPANTTHLCLPSELERGIPPPANVPPIGFERQQALAAQSTSKPPEDHPQLDQGINLSSWNNNWQSQPDLVGNAKSPQPILEYPQQGQTSTHQHDNARYQHPQYSPNPQYSRYHQYHQYQHYVSAFNPLAQTFQPRYNVGQLNRPTIAYPRNRCVPPTIDHQRRQNRNQSRSAPPHFMPGFLLTKPDNQGNIPHTPPAGTSKASVIAHKSPLPVAPNVKLPPPSAEETTGTVHKEEALDKNLEPKTPHAAVENKEVVFQNPSGASSPASKPSFTALFAATSIEIAEISAKLRRSEEQQSPPPEAQTQPQPQSQLQDVVPITTSTSTPPQPGSASSANSAGSLTYAEIAAKGIGKRSRQSSSSSMK